MSTFTSFVNNLVAADLPPLPQDIDAALLRISRTHSSLIGSTIRSFETDELAQDYQRLEHLGDKVIGMATTDILFKDYPLLTCAAMTIIGSRVVANDTLSFIGKAYSLHHHLQAHLHQVSTLRTNPKIQADLVEALVGALCVQSGLQVALVFAKNVLRPFIQLAYQEAGSFHHPTSVLVVGNGVFEVAASSHADSGFGDEEEDDNGPGFDLNKGPSYVMALEEWKKERGATGREVAYMKGKSGGSSNEPLHSGSLVIRFNNVGKEFGPWDRRSWSEVQGRPAIPRLPRLRLPRSRLDGLPRNGCRYGCGRLDPEW